MLTSALTFPIVFLQALLTVCPFLYLPIGMNLPSLMSRQVSLAGLPISAEHTASMASSLVLLVILFFHLRHHSGLQTSHLLFFLSPGFPHYPAPAHLTLSPPGLVLVAFTPSLWLCQFFWFRCLFSLSRLIHSYHFLQEPTQSCMSPNMVYVPQIDINYLLAFLLL